MIRGVAVRRVFPCSLVILGLVFPMVTTQPEQSIPTPAAARIPPEIHHYTPLHSGFATSSSRIMLLSNSVVQDMIMQ